MKTIVSIFLLTVAVHYGLAQSETERKLVIEAKKLYKSDMASWYGTDIFMAKFQDKRPRARGYFSYVEKGKATCVFFSDDTPRKILASFTFDSTYNINTAVVDGTEREMNSMETDLVAIRTTALEEFQTDKTLFKKYEKTNPNFIPLSDEFGKRVYILTGPQENGVVIFGNDYLLTFDDQNKLIEKKQLHSNPVITESKGTGEKVLVTSMHTHLPTTGDLITATDICTLMLYCPYTQWKQHIVMSKNFVSIWTCGKGLAVMPREAWDKIGDMDKYLNKLRN
ncbi:MAG: hypothetical protein WDO15_09345 [Bacteroidota bacterium]